MKQILRLLGASSVVGLLLFSGCSEFSAEKEQGEGQSFSNLRSESFIEVPDAIAKSASTTRGTDEQNEAAHIYEGVRDFVGFADELVHDNVYGVKAQILFWRDELDWGLIEQIGKYTHTNELEQYSITASYDSTATYAYGLVIRSLKTSDSPIALKIAFNGDFDLPAGEMYYHVGLLSDNGPDDVEIKVAFVETENAKTLDIEAVNNAITDAEDEIKSLKLSLKEVNGVIHMSGCATYPNVDGVLVGVEGHSYVFTGVADEKANQAIIKLGVPGDDYDKNDETLFTTYGVQSVYIKSVMETDIAELEEDEKVLLVTSYKENLTVEEIMEKVALGDSSFLHSAAEVETMTEAELITFLTINKDISDPELKRDFRTLLWIAELTQPVYFDKSGYAGNGATAPAGFETLAVVTPHLSAFVPVDVAQLTITVE